jgi:hypothetical protein
MLPESVWWRGNPHYDLLWRSATPQQRLQKQVLEALLIALPESVGQLLLQELAAARHPGQVQALRTQELTQGAIDAVLAAVAHQAVNYRLRGQELPLVPLERLRLWAGPDLQQALGSVDEHTGAAGLD